MACIQPAEAVPDEVNLSAGFLERFVHGSGKTIADQQVGTFCVQSDIGKVGSIANALKPVVEVTDIEVGSQESGNHDDGRAVSALDAQTIVNRRGMQEQKISRAQCLLPDRNISLRLTRTDAGLRRRRGIPAPCPFCLHLYYPSADPEQPARRRCVLEAFDM